MQRFLLSPNFYLDEFCRSQTAERLGRPIVVKQDSEIIQNLKQLCATVLQPLRDEFGVSITITSGYRPKWLNDHIGGSQTSHHLFGLAADLVVPGIPPLQVAQAIERLKLPFQQVINEYGSWTHVAVPPIGEEPLRQALTFSHNGEQRCVKAGLHDVVQA